MYNFLFLFLHFQFMISLLGRNPTVNHEGSVTIPHFVVVIVIFIF